MYDYLSTVPVGKTVRIEDIRLTLKVVPAKEGCHGCFFSHINHNECRQYRDKYVGECVSWRRDDNQRIIFKAL